MTLQCSSSVSGTSDDCAASGRLDAFFFSDTPLRRALVVGGSGILCVFAPSVSPSLMGKRRGVQLLPMQAPLRQAFVHDRHEPVVVVPLHQVHQFVDDQVFEALHRLLRQLQVQPDTAGVDVACTLLGFHLFNTPVGDLNPQNTIPATPARAARRPIPPARGVRAWICSAAQLQAFPAVP